MKLYNVPKGTYIRIYNTNVKVPPIGSQLYTDLKFHTIDGAYSYCTYVHTNEVVHIDALTEVHILCDNNGNPIKKYEDLP